MKKILMLAGLFLFIPLTCWAEGIKLPSGAENIYAVGGKRAYTLKVKLTPKVTGTKVYWQGKEDIDWPEEVKNWYFGMLPAQEKTPPIIISYKNFYPLEKAFREKYRWGGNNMRLLVVNPSKETVKATFFFSANSYKKDRELQIRVNGTKVKNIEIASRERGFLRYVVEDIVLREGVNEVLLYIPQGTGSLEGKDVSIKFKDDMRFEITSFLAQKTEVGGLKYKYEIKNNKLDLLFYPEDKIVLMSRALNINLEEYPYFNLFYKLKNPDRMLDGFFGIDYTGDGKIEGWLTSHDLKELHLLDMAKEKWGEKDYRKYGFKLVKMVLILHPDGMGKELGGAGQVYEIHLKNFQFYNPSSIYIPFRSRQNWQWKGRKNSILENILNTSYLAHVDEKGNMVFSCYFDSRGMGTETIEKGKGETRIFLRNGKEFTGEVEERNEEEIKLKKVRELGGEDLIIKNDAIAYSLVIPKEEKRKKLLEEEEATFSFPLDYSLKSGTIFKLVYKLQAPSVQDMKVFLGVDMDGDGRVDKEVVAGEKEILRGWKFTGTQSDMDLYQTFASSNFPESYKSKPEIKEKKFIIYKGNIPLKTTWGKWYGGIELAEVGYGQARKVVVSVPQREFPGDDYSIIYDPLTRVSASPGYRTYEADLSWLTKKYGHLSVKKVFLCLKRKEAVDLNQERKGWYSFYLKDIGFYQKFTYPIKDRKLEGQLLKAVKKTNLPLIMLDKKLLGTDSFEDWTDFQEFEGGGTIRKRINLRKGEHYSLKILENDTFKVEYALLEPITNRLSASTQREPEITFKKINPTKYYVRVQGAKRPFWLVFSESFHKQWKIYKVQGSKFKVQSLFDNIIADYPKFGVKEAKHRQRFTPSDIRYLFRRADIKKHYLVNGYANGWYVDPKKLGSGEDFTLVLYFWPQSLFYLGLGISGVTLIGFLGYLLASFIKKKPKNED